MYFSPCTAASVVDGYAVRSGYTYGIRGRDFFAFCDLHSKIRHRDLDTGSNGSLDARDYKRFAKDHICANPVDGVTTTETIWAARIHQYRVVQKDKKISFLVPVPHFLTGRCAYYIVLTYSFGA